MKNKIIQDGFNWKKKEKIYREITYEFFSKNIGTEWIMNYRDNTIDIAWHIDKNTGKAVYELTINGLDKQKAIFLEFNTPEDLLKYGKIDGKTLKDLWDEIEIV